MGEISNNVIIVLALAVIVVSAASTWVVLDVTQEAVSGIRTSAMTSEDGSFKGYVSISVNGTVPDLESRVTGMVSVRVNGSK
jgi:hypothetical protein